MTDARAPILNLSPCFPGPNKILVQVVAIVPGWLETECGIYHICEKKFARWKATSTGTQPTSWPGPPTSASVGISPRPHAPASLNNLARLYHAQGRYVEAEPLYKRALAIKEKALRPEHLRVAASLLGLAALYQAQDRYAEAEPLFKRALAIMEKALGQEHPHLATSLENYAPLLRNTGRTTEATKMELRAKAIRAKHAEQNPAK